MEKKYRSLEDYKRLPYRLYLEPLCDSDGSKYWTAEYIELRGCKTEGETEAEAVINLQELFDEYILTKIESDAEIPIPTPTHIADEDITIIVEGKKQFLAHDAMGTEETKNELEYQKFEKNIAA